MRLNNTTTIPNEIVREIIAFVRPSGISKFDVELRNSAGSFAGRAYHAGSGYHATASPFVVLRIGHKFPSAPEKEKRGAGYLPVPWLASRIEALVLLTAHELRHLWQAKHKKGWRVWGARGQFSERDADAYALRKLREWRRKP